MPNILLSGMLLIFISPKRKAILDTYVLITIGDIKSFPNFIWSLFLFE